jgi:hypothetical protein
MSLCHMLCVSMSHVACHYVTCCMSLCHMLRVPMSHVMCHYVTCCVSLYHMLHVTMSHDVCHYVTCCMSLCHMLRVPMLHVVCHYVTCYMSLYHMLHVTMSHDVCHYVTCCMSLCHMLCVTMLHVAVIVSKSTIRPESDLTRFSPRLTYPGPHATEQRTTWPPLVNIMKTKLANRLKMSDFGKWRRGETHARVRASACATRVTWRRVTWCDAGSHVCHGVKLHKSRICYSLETHDSKSG